jgi:hypothetical protein
LAWTSATANRKDASRGIINRGAAARGVSAGGAGSPMCRSARDVDDHVCAGELDNSSGFCLQTEDSAGCAKFSLCAFGALTRRMIVSRNPVYRSIWGSCLTLLLQLDTPARRYLQALPRQFSACGAGVPLALPKMYAITRSASLMPNSFAVNVLFPESAGTRTNRFPKREIGSRVIRPGFLPRK